MFTKEKSAILKGCAIIMMVYHHCFLSGRFENYSISFWPLSVSAVTHIASFFKICVSLFAFISGYGLLLSYQGYVAKTERADRGNWIVERLVKTLSSYWFVLVCSWVVCMALDGLPVLAYSFDTSSKLYGCWNMLIEFLGLSNLVGRDPMNGTWWYMSAAVAFIILVPLVDLSLRNLGSRGTILLTFILPRMLSSYPGGTSFVSFLLAFVCGMAFAYGDWFTKWFHFWSGQQIGIKILKFAGMSAALVFIYKIYYRLPTDQYWDIKWGFMPLIVILYINDYISEIPGIRKSLVYLGKHSTNIFLTHTFVRHYYAMDFTYNMKHFVLIIIVLLGISLVISYTIEYLKKLLHYDYYLNKAAKWLFL